MRTRRRRAHRGQARGRVPGSAIAALVLTVLVVGAAVAADTTLSLVGAQEADPVAQEPARAGAWYCPATTTDDVAVALTVAAVGSEPAEVTVVRYADGERVADDPLTVEPGESADVGVEATDGDADADAEEDEDGEDGEDGEEATAPVVVHWEGGPAVASWRRGGTDEAAAACEPAPANRWHLSGLDTAAGSQSTIHLFNPFTVDAVARLVFATADGRVALVRTDNVLVEAGTSLAFDVNEVQPEEPDLGAVVDVLSGRLVATGETSYQPVRDQPGPTGRTLVPAAHETGLEWAFAYARADDDTSSWLSVLNPADREAAVEVRATDQPEEGAVGGERSVPAGGVLRIDLAEMSEADEFAVGVRSVNDVPVTVTRTVDRRAGGGRQGMATSLAVAPVEQQALPGGGAEQRAGFVDLFNPGGDPVTVDVDASEGTPEEWAGIELDPFERRSLRLADAGADRALITPVVRGSGPLVSGLRSTSEGDELDLWINGGIGEPAWRGPSERPVVRRDGTLMTTPFVSDELVHP